MNTQELLAEVQKLPLESQKELLTSLGHSIKPKPAPLISEEEFASYLLAKGIISEIPPGQYEEEEDFEPVEIEGEPISETIIRERR